MQRIPEPELMDAADQADAYAAADFADSNTRFADLVADRFPDLPAVARVVDLGTGPADIPIRLAGRHPGWTFDAVDGAEAMLAHARARVAELGLEARIRPVHAVLPADLPGGYDLVLSNSLLHHLHDPAVLWGSVAALGRTGAAVLIMDLARPQSPEAAQRIVDTYSADEPEVLRRDFYNSLCAAFRVDEVRAQLADAGLDLDVARVSDRHLVVAGVLG